MTDHTFCHTACSHAFDSDCRWPYLSGQKPYWQLDILAEIGLRCLMARVARTILMNTTGRLTLPADARHELGIEGETEFEVEVDTDRDAVILRPAVLLRREDAWAYTPEHRRLLAKAHQDSKKGRVRRMTESRLRELAD